MWSPEFHLQILETFGRGHLEFGFLHILENLKGFTPQRRRNGSSLGHPDESTRDRPTPSGRDGRTSPLNAIAQPEDGMPQRPIVADCNEHLIASTGNLASLSWWFFFGQAMHILEWCWHQNDSNAAPSGRCSCLRMALVISTTCLIIFPFTTTGNKRLKGKLQMKHYDLEFCWGSLQQTTT